MGIGNVRSVPQWGGADMRYGHVRYGHVPRPCEAGSSVTGKVPGAWGKLCKFLRALLAFRGGMVTVQTVLKKFKS